MNLSQPVAELPVTDVEQAQAYYRDRLGFTIEWIYPDREIGAVSHDEIAIFFRRTFKKIHPAAFWIYASDVDLAHQKFIQLGANIVADIEDKPWGQRQFSVQDLNGNLFHVHHDTAESE